MMMALTPMHELSMVCHGASGRISGHKESATAASKNKEDPTGIYKPSAEKPGYVRRGSKWHGMA